MKKVALALLALTTLAAPASAETMCSKKDPSICIDDPVAVQPAPATPQAAPVPYAVIPAGTFPAPLPSVAQSAQAAPAPVPQTAPPAPSAAVTPPAPVAAAAPQRQHPANARTSICRQGYVYLGIIRGAPTCKRARGNSTPQQVLVATQAVAGALMAGRPMPNTYMGGYGTGYMGYGYPGYPRPRWHRHYGW